MAAVAGYQIKTVQLQSDRRNIGTLNNEDIIKYLALRVVRFFDVHPSRISETDRTIIYDIIPRETISKYRNWQNLYALHPFFAEYNLTLEKCNKLRMIIDSNPYCLIVPNESNKDQGGGTFIALEVTIKKEERNYFALVCANIQAIQIELLKGAVTVLTIPIRSSEMLNQMIKSLKPQISIPYMQGTGTYVQYVDSASYQAVPGAPTQPYYPPSNYQQPYRDNCNCSLV